MNWDQLTDSWGNVTDNFVQYTPSGAAQRLLGKLHLAMPYNNGAAQDLTATVSTTNPNSHSLNWLESSLLGITPQMKANDLQNDRRRYYATQAGKTEQADAELSGYRVLDENNKYINRAETLGDLGRSGANRKILNDEGVTYAQLGLKNASEKADQTLDDGTVQKGARVSPVEITQRAQAFKARRDLINQIQKEGGVPEGASMTELNTQLRELKGKNEADNAARKDRIKYGTKDADGNITGGTVGGRIEREQANEALATSRSVRNINEGNLSLNQTIARNNKDLQDYQNQRGAYEYEDLKAQAEVERLFQAAQADAKFAADLETLKLQNAAEMDRYNLMIQNDREVRRGDTISDLIQSLVLFGGAMDIA